MSRNLKHCTLCDKRNHSTEEHMCNLCGSRGHIGQKVCFQCINPEFKCYHTGRPYVCPNKTEFKYCKLCGSYEHMDDEHSCNMCGGKGHRTDFFCKKCESSECLSDGCGYFGSHWETLEFCISRPIIWCRRCKVQGHTTRDHQCKFCNDIDHNTEGHVCTYCGELGHNDNNEEIHLSMCKRYIIDSISKHTIGDLANIIMKYVGKYKNKCVYCNDQVFINVAHKHIMSCKEKTITGMHQYLIPGLQEILTSLANGTEINTKEKLAEILLVHKFNIWMKHQTTKCIVSKSDKKICNILKQQTSKLEATQIYNLIEKIKRITYMFDNNWLSEYNQYIYSIIGDSYQYNKYKEKPYEHLLYK